MSQFKVCDNPACLRKVSEDCYYCCGPCTAAHEGTYEIHAHTPTCDERATGRGEWELRQADIQRLQAAQT